MAATGYHVNILGTRGVPAAHSGFEYFADHFARWLVAQGHSVTVYCQGPQEPKGSSPRRWEDDWQGVHRIHYSTRTAGTPATMEFDLKAAWDVRNRPGVDLVLGYNTAVFNLIQTVFGRRVFMNMDGIEWIRQKWSFKAKAWFFLNELVGANITRPIADHPEMAKHVSSRSLRKPVMIAYGSPRITTAPTDPLASYGLTPDGYLISIARPVPENSILQVVRAYSAQQHGVKLMVLGNFDPANPYHREVRQAASGDVIFPGGIYDPDVVQALRFHARAYLHGHTVGGTNPSLVEALGAGNAVIAHNNRFNRWTAGADQFYFADEAACAEAMRSVVEDPERLARARSGARLRHAEAFELDDINRQYFKALFGLNS
ncbi:MAG: DUF1972 domain-containing protein [Gemmobacter sp.]|nr:DUF1972 domain-containing protein [Gemmobacter sp.]